jgi:Flp pilus assembly protein TadG
MLMHSIFTRLRDQILSFGGNRDGNIAMIFALCSLPVVGMMGAAVDYSRANAVKADLQSALDATALMVSKSAPNLTATELQTAANSYFAALFQSAEAGTTTITATYTSTNSTVKVDGITSVNTDFIGVLGPSFKNLPVNGSASVSWGSSRLRVALALDNTGSMASSSKMTALKTAAKALLTQLQSAAQNPGDVYVSIVPFAKDVNVGPANYNSTWVDFKDHGSWDGWDSENGDDVNSTTCTKNGKKKKCTTSTSWVPDNHNTWNGCVTDRDQDNDVLATSPDSTKQATLFPAEQYDECPTAMMTQTYDWTALKNKIDAMSPAGNTNVTIGVSLGWQTLMTGAPFFAPAEQSGYKYNKVLIVLTDGDNTENRFSTSQSSIDDRTKKACANAKAAGITIYTVLVIDGSQSLLQACASDATKYFYMQSSSGLVSAFNQIGTDLTNLRVSK